MNKGLICLHSQFYLVQFGNVVDIVLMVMKQTMYRARSRRAGGFISISQEMPIKEMEAAWRKKFQGGALEHQAVIMSSRLRISKWSSKNSYLVLDYFHK